jgi:hypothetical protein
MAEHEAFWRGAELFDRGAYFEAHEAWEERWLTSTDRNERLFLQGLIQVTAAFHKLLDKNAPDSAARLLARGLAKLNACPELIPGLNLRTFRTALEHCEANLKTKPFDRTTIPCLIDPASSR